MRISSINQRPHLVEKDGNWEPENDVEPPEPRQKFCVGARIIQVVLPKLRFEFYGNSKNMENTHLFERNLGGGGFNDFLFSSLLGEDDPI